MRGVSFPYMTKNYTDCAFARTMAERARATTIIRHIPSATAFTDAHDMARATVTHALPQQNARIRWAANRLGKHASTPSQLFGKCLCTTSSSVAQSHGANLGRHVLDEHSEWKRP